MKKAWRDSDAEEIGRIGDFGNGEFDPRFYKVGEFGKESGG